MKSYSVDDVMPVSKIGLLPVTVAFCLAFSPAVFADEDAKDAANEAQKTENTVTPAPAAEAEKPAAEAEKPAAEAEKPAAEAEKPAAEAEKPVAEAEKPAAEAEKPAAASAAATAEKPAAAAAPAKDVLALAQRQNKVDAAKNNFYAAMKLAQEAYKNGDYEKSRKFLAKIKLEVEEASSVSGGMDRLLSDIQAKTYLEEIAALKQKCDRDDAEKLYKTSRDLYLEAASRKDDLAKAGEECNKAIQNLRVAKNLYYTGNRLADTDEIKKAVASSLDSSFADKVDVLIEQAEKISDYVDLVTSSSLENIDPAYLDNQRLIAQYYRESEQFFRKQRYDQARMSLEKILTIDPFNENATELLKKVYKKLYTIGDMRLYNELLMDQALTEWRWAEKFPNQDAEERIVPMKEEVSEYTAIYDKASKIKIPSVNFSGMKLIDAVSALRDLSKQYDPEHTGLNIIAIGNKDDDKGKEINLSLQDVSLLQVLRYLTMFAGLKYYIDEKKQNILIAPAEEIAKRQKRDRIVLRVLQSTVGRMIDANKDRTASADADEGTNDKDKDGADMLSGPGRVKPKEKVDYRKELMTYFNALGFPFDFNDKNSEDFITYDPASNEMTIKATPDVLRQLTDLIKRLDISAPLILIEAKIMEISLDDMEELGFDWTLEHTADNMLPNWNFKVTSPYKSYMPMDESGDNTIDTKVINNLNLLPNFGSDSSWNLFLTVNALDMQSRSEILSTPKVTTRNAEKAKISMIRQEYFPNSEWSEPEVETEDNSISLTPSIPEFDNADNLGIEFSLTPTVNTTNSMITLDELHPLVTEFVGWTDYSYEILYNGEKAKNPIKMPEISVREVETNIKVYDGQSVVIGGMLVDAQAKNDGRWPVLGDLPLVGRLFGNRSTIIRKNNLMISVTARLINQFGLPINTNSQNGLPEFGR